MTKLQALINTGVAHFDGQEYTAKASDGEPVILGSAGNEWLIEEYLNDCPMPEDW